MVDERGPCPQPSKACGLTTEEIAPGFTGIEVATEMPEKLRRVLANGAGRVILVDPNPVVGATIGDHARPVICDALMSLGIETRLGAKVSAIDASAATLASGEIIPAQTVVWCGGMRANPLTAALRGTRDGLGRLAVDPFMRVAGLANVFAAGDVASSLVDGAPQVRPYPWRGSVLGTRTNHPSPVWCSISYGYWPSACGRLSASRSSSRTPAATGFSRAARFDRQDRRLGADALTVQPKR
jgi:hypothetical protein